MVLATDMSSHFQQIKAMKNILNHGESFNADKSKILSLVIHISDISHPAKDWELHNQWTSLLMEEFFRQGDREKELDLECSPLCDRETTLVAESQLGFIEFIVSPSLEICGDVLDRVHYQMAEANSRPVLPASAKAASVVAAVTTSKSGGARGQTAGPSCSVGLGQQVAAITAGPSSDKQQEQQEQAQQQQQHFSASSDKNTATGDTSTGTRQLSEGQDMTQATPATVSDLLKQISMDATSGEQSTVSSSCQQPLPVSVASGPTPQQQQRKPSINRSQTPRQHSASSVTSSSPSAASTGSSYASIFVASETIASNLRKMIASSSASISKKLNKTAAAMTSDSNQSLASTTTNNSSIAASHAFSANQQQARVTTTMVAQKQPTGTETEPGAERTESLAEFEARQANYRHPVIQCDHSSTSTGGLRSPKLDADTVDRLPVATSGDDGATTNTTNTVVAANSGELSLKRSGATLAATGQTSRSAPPLQYFKIQRPWINCLERNKRMWRERALNESRKSNI